MFKSLIVSIMLLSFNCYGSTDSEGYILLYKGQDPEPREVAPEPSKEEMAASEAHAKENGYKLMKRHWPRGKGNKKILN